MISKMLGLAGAASLLVAGSAVSAQTAEPSALAGAVRSGAELSSASAIRGDAKWILGGIALALIVWGAIELLDNGPEDFPNSP
jgi:hypothetical protein